VKRVEIGTSSYKTAQFLQGSRPCHGWNDWLHLTMEAKVHPLARSCGICGGQSGTVTAVILCTSILPCLYHSTNAAHSFRYLSPKLYNQSSWQHP